MNRARNFSRCARLAMAMTVAFAPAVRDRRGQGKVRRGAASHRGGFREASARGRRAAGADHPDDAGGAAALRHGAPAASVGGRAPSGRHLPSSAGAAARDAAAPPPARPAATGRRERGKSASSGERVGTVSGRVEARGGDAQGRVRLCRHGQGIVGARPHAGDQAEGQAVLARRPRWSSAAPASCSRTWTPSFTTSSRRRGATASTSAATGRGITPRSVVLTTPGVVEVFCNIHSKMNANILVVPGPLYAKVGADGSYRIENVPVGARRIVAWSPNAKAVQQKIEVGSERRAGQLHAGIRGREGAPNKLGQPYGSYKE